MTKSVARRPNSQNLLTQIISNNQLVKDVQNLEATVVKKLIHHIGLEDSAELLMMITSEQLQEVMDQDTWKSAMPGDDEALDAKRFCTWIEVLLEVGPDFAVDKVTDMDEELLTSVLGQLVLALDSDVLHLLTRSAEGSSSSDQYLEKALESTYSMEVEGYTIMSKCNFDWEPVADLFGALGKDHRDLIERILLRLSKISSEQMDEFDGLFNLLKEQDMLDGDVSFARQERREKEGYVGPSSAKAFLKLIQQTPIEKIVSEKEDDHITKMYFRGLRPSKIKQSGAVSADLLQLLSVHGVDVSPPTLKQLSSTTRPSQVRGYLSELATSDQDLFKKKIAEMNFLANILVSGHSVGNRPLRPVEAMELAIEICDRGHEYLDHERGDFEMIKIFKIGWSLFQDKSAR